MAMPNDDGGIAERFMDIIYSELPRLTGLDADSLGIEVCDVASRNRSFDPRTMGPLDIEPVVVATVCIKGTVITERLALYSHRYYSDTAAAFQLANNIIPSLLMVLHAEKKA